MNLIQQAMQAIFGIGKSASARRRREKGSRWVPVGTQFQDHETSRQTRRAYLRDLHFQRVRGNATGAESRKERRKLARAFAVGAFRKQRAAEASGKL